MENLILILNIILAILLVGVILLQRSEGGALGLGISQDNFISSRSASSFLTKTTAIIATLFIITSISLTIMSKEHFSSTSVLEKIEEEKELQEILLEYDKRKSNLKKINFFKADLRKTLFTEANLTGAYLSSTLLQDTDFQWANLSKAVMRYSLNLTAAQIQSAKIDRETKVPHYLKIHWISETDFCCKENSV